MKKYFLLLLIVSISANLSAQKGLKRFKNEVFTSIDSVTNIEYGIAKNIKGEDEHLFLNFLHPTSDTSKKRPLVIFVHGGGFVNGDKGTGYSKYITEKLTARGFAVGSINYRLGVENPKHDTSYFKAMIRALQDTKAAIRFFRKNFEKYGIDTSKIFLAGGSAGGMTVLHTAYLNQDEIPKNINIDLLGGLEGHSGNEGYSTKIHGVINFWGAIADYKWIKSGDVPVFNVHGMADKLVPFDSTFSYHPFKYGSSIIFERALSVGIPTGLNPHPNLGHTLDNNKIAFAKAVDEVSQWLYALIHKSANPEGIKRFEKEIRKHEEDDQVSSYTKQAVLFTGSSYIRLWKSIKEDLAPTEIIHRGFGGSNISEMAYFVSRIVDPHPLKAVFMYSGSNDITVGTQDKTPQQILETFKYVVKKIKLKHPETPIYYLAISPNERRWAVWDDIKMANALLKSFCESTPNMHFVESESKLLGADGMYQKDLYVEDKLHFNQKGYKIWTEIVRKTLAEMK